MGGGTKIYDTDFHWLNLEERINQPGGKTAPVIIKDGAFVGADCIILKGVTIGKRAVIGAGSVVTKSVPDGEIWAGNPAKLIRKLDEVRRNEKTFEALETKYASVSGTSKMYI